MYYVNIRWQKLNKYSYTYFASQYIIKKLKFTTKTGKFSDKKKTDVFHIPAYNIDCGYSLEPLRRGGSNEYPQSFFFFFFFLNK